jgi:hypothetical protein
MVWTPQSRRMLAVNDQYRPGASKFFTTVPETTGAAGSQGAMVSEHAPLATVTVTDVYGSSQTAQPSALVGVGDTNAMPGDAPVPAGGDPLTGLSVADVCDTGAGHGSLRDLSPKARPS